MGVKRSQQEADSKLKTITYYELSVYLSIASEFKNVFGFKTGYLDTLDRVNPPVYLADF
jgi:hypothetical protein